MEKVCKLVLVGILLMKDVVANYMQYQVDGGIRTDSKFIPIPFVPNARLNKFGNIIGKKTGLIKKQTQFMGTVKGTTGVWERTNKNQRVKLIIGFEKSATYKPRFPFYIIAQKFSANVFDKNFIKSFNRAIKSAK